MRQNAYEQNKKCQGGSYAKRKSKLLEFRQTTPPEIPPNFPPEQPALPVVPVPMVYVETPEKIEYRVIVHENPEAEILEAELNRVGKEGWWLLQIFRQDKQVFLVFSRRLKD